MNVRNSTSGPRLQDTMESCIFPDREVPVTGDGTLEQMDQEFQQHCTNRFNKLLEGASQMVEEPSITSVDQP